MRKPALSKFKPKKKVLLVIVVVVAVAAVAVVGCSKLRGEEKVKFTALAETEVPQQLLQDILPEYNKLERALACIVDEQIYIVATRGEKPTSGYTVAIEKIQMQDNDGMKKMVVYATFADPKPEEVLSQVLTYPYCVVKADVDVLPDEIELKVKY